MQAPPKRKCNKDNHYVFVYNIVSAELSYMNLLKGYAPQLGISLKLLLLVGNPMKMLSVFCSVSSFVYFLSIVNIICMYFCHDLAVFLPK